MIERIAKQYYIVYMQRHHTKSVTKKNKRELKDLLKSYALNNLQIEVTEDMLDRKVDLFYKDIKLEFYGSIFNKISLFVTKEGVDVDISAISKMVKLRNKIAHGDVVSNEQLLDGLAECEYLAMQIFSIYFFRARYEELHINSYRYFNGVDPYR